jgi:hypothetical protein
MIRIGVDPVGLDGAISALWRRVPPSRTSRVGSTHLHILLGIGTHQIFLLDSKALLDFFCTSLIELQSGIVELGCSNSLLLYKVEFLFVVGYCHITGLSGLIADLIVCKCLVRSCLILFRELVSMNEMLLPFLMIFLLFRVTFRNGWKDSPLMNVQHT